MKEKIQTGGKQTEQWNVHLALGRYEIERLLRPDDYPMYSALKSIHRGRSRKPQSAFGHNKTIIIKQVHEKSRAFVVRGTTNLWQTTLLNDIYRKAVCLKSELDARVSFHGLFIWSRNVKPVTRSYTENRLENSYSIINRSETEELFRGCILLIGPTMRFFGRGDSLDVFDLMKDVFSGLKFNRQSVDRAKRNLETITNSVANNEGVSKQSCLWQVLCKEGSGDNLQIIHRISFVDDDRRTKIKLSSGHQSQCEGNVDRFNGMIALLTVAVTRKRREKIESRG